MRMKGPFGSIRVAARHQDFLCCLWASSCRKVPLLVDRRRCIYRDAGRRRNRVLTTVCLSRSSPPPLEHLISAEAVKVARRHHHALFFSLLLFPSFPSLLLFSPSKPSGMAPKRRRPCSSWHGGDKELSPVEVGISSVCRVLSLPLRPRRKRNHQILNYGA